jgi:hypothetical protein
VRIVTRMFVAGVLLGASVYAEEAAPKVVPFRVENFVEAGAALQHVQGGIPLPRGMAAADAMFMVRKAGELVPAEVRATGYWPDGSVKWVLVILQPAVAPLSGVEYTLEIGGASEEEAGGSFASQDDERISVDTGVLKFSIRRDGANLFESAAINRDGAYVPALDAGSGLYAVIERKNEEATKTIRFDGNGDGDSFSAVLEDASPLRAVIRIEGTHVSDGGESFGPYTLRIYAHRNSGLLRMVHTVMFDNEPRQDFIRSIGVQLNLPEQLWESYSFGEDQGPGARTAYTDNDYEPTWRRAVLVQDSAQHFSAKKWVNPETNSSLTLSEGQRSQGWASIQTASHQITTGIKNFWQEYPKSISVDALDRQMDVQFHSEHAASLDLRRYSDLGYHGLYEAGAAKPGTPATPFNHEKYNARYISKTAEMFIDFAPGHPAATHAAATALLFQRPPLLRASMAWMAGTGALGAYASKETANVLPEAAALLAQCSNFFVTEQARHNWYSFIDYGDVMHSFDTTRDVWCFDKGGYAWMNNEAQMSGSTWMAYLFSGDERVYRFAEAMTRHVQDVDMFHDGPLAGCGMRHNVNHWGCVDRERRMTIPFNKRIYYFLSGDESTRDRIHFIYQQMTAQAGNYPAMDYGVAGYGQLFMWETTGEAAYGEALKKTSETFCSKAIGGYGFPAQFNIDFKTGEGSIREGMTMLPSFFLVSFGPMALLMEASELTESAIVRDAVLNWATLLLMPPEEAKEKQLHLSTGAVGALANMGVAAFAYRHTGDMRYLDFVRSGLSQSVLRFEEKGGDGALERPRHWVIRTTEDKTGGAERFQSNTAAALLYNYPHGLGALSAETSPR